MQWLKSRLRSKKNQLTHLIDANGAHLKDLTEIREAAPEYYNELFSQDSYWNVFPKLVVKRKLTPEARKWLIRPVTKEEVKQAVFQLNAEKAPGFDGFTAGFFQKNWSLVGEETTEAIISFFTSGRLIQELNHTCIASVPKSLDAIHLNDFRLIFCCNTLYKFITKILANRLLSVIDGLISENQCAFLKDRLISDCFLLSHELARDFNKPMGSRACIKIDLKKTFDSTNGEFVYFIMHCICMGFPTVWINWIKECIQKSVFSVMINGSCKGFFWQLKGY